MGSMKDQLDGLYNGEPGYKEPTTSKDAAKAIKGRAETLREKALECIRVQASTPDEVAAALGETVLAVRPRITELANAGKIQKTGARRKNVSGMSATVWEISHANPA
jgi:hypothetical protein